MKKIKLARIKWGKTIVILFSFFGMFIFQVIIHENFHKFDYRNIEKISEETCYLNFDKTDFNTLAYHKFYPNGTNQYEEVERIQKFTELKAYLLSVIIIIFYFIFLTKFLVFER